MKKEDLKKLKKKEPGYKFKGKLKIVPNVKESMSKESRNNKQIITQSDYESPFMKDKFFLLERFILNQRIKTIKIIEESPEEDYKSICVDLMLENLFLKKLHLDLGFRLKIYDDINNHPNILRKIMRDVLIFYNEKDLFQNFSDKINDLQDDYEVYEKNLILNMNELRQYYQIFSSAFLKDKNKEVWFYCLWIFFREKGKIPEAIAIESILMEFISEYYQGHNLFWKSMPYGKNRNPHYYLLSGINEIIENLDPFFLDYIEAQRKNMLLCEEIQKIIDNLNYHNLKSVVSELFKHFRDLMSMDLDIIDKIMIKGRIMNICGIIYFNDLKFEEKIELLNKFYGIDTIIEKIQNNNDLYPLEDLISDLPIWYKYNLLPKFYNFIDSKQAQLKAKLQSEDEIDNSTYRNYFILIKYLCKILIKQEKFSEAFKILYLNFQIIASVKEALTQGLEIKSIIDIKNHIHIEIFFLFGEIVIKAKKKAIIKFVMKIFDKMAISTSEQKVKLKFKILKSVLFRMKEDFEKEHEILDDLNKEIKDIRENEELNPLELMHYICPPHLMFSEDFNPERMQEHMANQQSLLWLENEALIPIMSEQYFIYADIRKNLLDNFKTYPECLYWEEEVLLNENIFKCLQLQSLACFSECIGVIKNILELSIGINNPEKLRIIMETIAFPYFYFRDYKNSKFYLEEALIYNPNDVYYYKYLVVINLLLGYIDEAGKYLMKLYMVESNKISYDILWYIRSTYNSLIIQFKTIQFLKIITKLINEPTCVRFFATRLSKIYCDIGHTFADLGYFKEALEYFQKAIENSHDEKFKASLLNNIGTVYSDLRQLDIALEKFKEANLLNPYDLGAWMNIAKMHKFKLNFLRAKEVYMEAAEFFSSKDVKLTAYLELQGNLMDISIKGILNLNLVKNLDALSHLQLAHQLVININRMNYLSENTGIIFISLVNGFDCLFHSTISQIFLNKLLTLFPANSKLPKDLQKKLPLGIREIWRGKHMSMGNIDYLIKSLLDPNSNDPIKEFKKLLPPQITDEDLIILQKFANLARKTRNPGSHGGIIDQTEFIKNIPSMIETLNKAIIIFDKINKE